MECLKWKFQRWCILLVAMSAVSSCSSISLQLDGPESVCKEPTAYIYGGTVRNAILAFGGVSAAAAGGEYDGLGVLMAGYAVIDFPFSLIADTLFLPLSVPRTILNCNRKSSLKKSEFRF